MGRERFSHVQARAGATEYARGSSCACTQQSTHGSREGMQPDAREGWSLGCSWDQSRILTEGQIQIPGARRPPAARRPRPLGPLGFEGAQHRQTLRASVDGVRSKALRPFGASADEARPRQRSPSKPSSTALAAQGPERGVSVRKANAVMSAGRTSTIFPPRARPPTTFTDALHPRRANRAQNRRSPTPARRVASPSIGFS